MTKKLLTRISALVLTFGLLAGTAACQDPTNPSTADDPEGETKVSEEASEQENKEDVPENEAGTGDGDNIVNIGMTYPITSMNPLLMDASEAMKYAVGIAFEPLVELNSNYEFEGVLAESITLSDDKTVFTVKLKDDAAWSDGVPITADDVIFTVLRTTSETVNNTSMSMFYLFKGFNEIGQVPDDAESVEGLVKVDDKTIEFHATEALSMENFNNNFMRYLCPIPKHILGDMTSEELKTTEWFASPDVVSGPYRPTSADLAHFVTYEANENYWQGKPKIEKLNIKIVTGSQLFAGMQSGEIDYVQQTTGVFAQEDIPSVEKLENAEAVYDNPVTPVLTFVNTKTVEDKRVRQAIVHAIDRELLVKEFLRGKGEVVDGFLTSASPYFDDTHEVMDYNPEKAKELLAEADWDSSQVLDFKIDSGDSTFAQAANVIVAQLAEVGIKAQITSLNLTQLLTDAAAHDFDLLSVQYTLPPVAPSLDVAWLAGPGGWPDYGREETNELIDKASLISEDDAKLKEVYREIHTYINEDVPVINMYATAPIGARSKRLKAQDPSVFGGFMNLHTWEIA